MMARMPDRDAWRALLHVVGAALLLSPWGAWSLTLPPELRAAANASLGKVVNCEFDAALAQIDSMIASDASRALGYLLKMCAIGLRDLDYSCVSDSSSFLDAYHRFQQAIAADALAARDSSYALTIRGFALATYASFCLRARRYREAVQAGLNALAELKDVQKRDPANADADFFLGLYECARAELRKRLWWILFWYPGSRVQGILRLERCAGAAEFSRLGARIALVDIYAQEKQYQRAFSIIEATLREYPLSRFMVWARARCYEMRGEYAAAADDYAHLVECYQSLSGAQHSAAATLWHQARMHASAQQPHKAIIACDTLFIRYGSRKETFFRELVRDARRLKERIERDG